MSSTGADQGPNRPKGRRPTAAFPRPAAGGVQPPATAPAGPGLSPPSFTRVMIADVAVRLCVFDLLGYQKDEMALRGYVHTAAWWGPRAGLTGVIVMEFSPAADVAHARRDDPETSHEAAASIRTYEILETQRKILRLLREFGPMTDPEIAQAWEEEYETRASPSGLRTRRSELCDKGLVKHSGAFQVGASGRRFRVWRLA